MNRIYNICKIELNENNYLKERTVCKSWYNQNRKKDNNNAVIQNENFSSIHKPKRETVNNNKIVYNPSVSTFENHAYDFVGLRNVGKTYCMLKILEETGNQRPIHIITRSPNQYPNYKTNNEIKPINKYKGSVVIFDDLLGARNCSQIDDIFTRRRHENLDVCFISHGFFGLPR